MLTGLTCQNGQCDRVYPQTLPIETNIHCMLMTDQMDKDNDFNETGANKYLEPGISLHFN